MHQRAAKASFKIASLNIKGRKSGEIEKWMHIPQVIRENNIAAMAVQETHLTDDLANQFQGLFGTRLTIHYSPDPQTRNARGVAIVLNKKYLKTDDVRETVIVPGRAIMVNLPWQDTQRINILAIYAPNSPREIKEFWKTITRKLNGTQPDVTLGDFNLVEDAIDRIPSKIDDPQAMEALREFKIKFNLVDGWRKANPTNKTYTWSRESDGTQSRIDRIYVRDDIFNECSNWETAPSPIPSDHDLITARISTPTSPKIGRGRWAIPTRLIKNKTIKKEIQMLGLKLQEDMERSQRRATGYRPQRLLKEFKTKVRDMIRAHEKKIQPMIKTRINNLSEKLLKVFNDPNLQTDEIKIAATQIKKEIQSLTRDLHHGNRNTVAAVDAAEGEKIGKTWS
ncbi:Endonuclease/exonuclease/phosphatase, partial [Thelephora terrestris]